MLYRIPEAGRAGWCHWVAAPTAVCTCSDPHPKVLQEDRKWKCPPLYRAPYHGNDGQKWNSCYCSLYPLASHSGGRHTYVLVTRSGETDGFMRQPASQARLWQPEERLAAPSEESGKSQPKESPQGGGD